MIGPLAVAFSTFNGFSAAAVVALSFGFSELSFFGCFTEPSEMAGAEELVGGSAVLGESVGFLVIGEGEGAAVKATVGYEEWESEVTGASMGITCIFGEGKSLLKVWCGFAFSARPAILATVSFSKGNAEV